MKYIIEKDVPMVTHRPLAGAFPFEDMSIGDSFTLNGELPQTVGYLAAVFARRQEPKWKFKVEKGYDDKYHCWRVG